MHLPRGSHRSLEHELFRGVDDVRFAGELGSLKELRLHFEGAYAITVTGNKRATTRDWHDSASIAHRDNHSFHPSQHLVKTLAGFWDSCAKRVSY
jgi:hypothetical protein